MIHTATLYWTTFCEYLRQLSTNILYNYIRLSLTTILVIPRQLSWNIVLQIISDVYQLLHFKDQFVANKSMTFGPNATNLVYIIGQCILLKDLSQNLPKFSMERTQNSVYNAQVSVYRTQKTNLPILLFVSLFLPYPTVIIYVVLVLSYENN